MENPPCVVDITVDHFPGKIMDETPVSFGWSDGKRLQFKRHRSHGHRNVVSFPMKNMVILTSSFFVNVYQRVYLCYPLVNVYKKRTGKIHHAING